MAPWAKCRWDLGWATARLLRPMLRARRRAEQQRQTLKVAPAQCQGLDIQWRVMGRPGRQVHPYRARASHDTSNAKLVSTMYTCCVCCRTHLQIHFLYLYSMLCLPCEHDYSSGWPYQYQYLVYTMRLARLHLNVQLHTFLHLCKCPHCSFPP